MIILRGTDCGSHITGRSTRNQRIERLWRDVFDNCLSLFYRLFYELEDNGALDVEDDMHLVSLHYVYTPRINESLSSFREAWNNHGLSSTSGNHTPLQLWTAGMLDPQNHDYPTVQEIFGREDNPHIQREPSANPQELSLSIHPMRPSNSFGVDIYAEVLETLLAR